MTDIALPASESRSFRLSLPLAFGLLAYVILSTTSLSGMMDPDTYWHIATGRWIIAHVAVPSTDVFSFSMAGAPWTSPEWFAEVLFAWLYDYLGWAGPFIATTLSFTVALALLLQALLRYIAPVYAMLATVLGWGVGLTHLLARPHALVLPLLVLWIAILVRSRAERRHPPLWLAALMCLWVNLHSSFIFGLGMAMMFAGEALLEAPDNRARIAVLRGWGLFGAASLGAALINPFGIDALLQPFHLVAMSANKFVSEWQSPDFQHNWPLELWIALVLFASVAKGWRLPWTRAAMLLLLLHMALQHQRFGELLGLIAPLLAAPALGPQLASPLASGESRLDRILAQWAKPASPLGIAMTATILVALSTIVWDRGIERQADAITPAAALAEVAAKHVEGPVLNDYMFGGYLIFTGIKPFIDGRYFYGDSFIERYVKAITGTSGDFPRLLDEYHINWTLLAPTTPANALLAHLPGWSRFYADDNAVVYVRDTPEQ